MHVSQTFTSYLYIIKPTWIMKIYHDVHYNFTYTNLDNTTFPQNIFTTHLYNQTYKKYELWKNNNHYVNHNFTKVSFFIQCTKMQLITLQNFNIQTCFSQFPWVFSLKCWNFEMWLCLCALNEETYFRMASEA